MELKGKKVLVTGASGFIGKHLCMRLLKEGCYVRAMIRKPSNTCFASNNIEVVQGNMKDPASLKRALRECHVVFHLAAILADSNEGYQEFYNVNVKGTRMIAEEALSLSIERFIYMSTSWVYGIDTRGRINENSPLISSKNFYCDTKLEAERTVFEYVLKGLKAIIIQPTQIYGPGGKWTIKPIKIIKSGMMIYPSNGSGLLQPLYIDDLVDGIILATLHGKVGQSYILCGTQVITVKEFFGYYADMVGRKWIPSVPKWLAVTSAILLGLIFRVINKPAPYNKTEVRSLTMHAIYDSSKAERELGFHPKINIIDGMKLIKEWLEFQSHL